jgi:phosphoglycerate dehydrogenase-like enzyme
MKSITKALITWNIKEQLLEDLKSQFPEVRFDVKLQAQEIDDSVREADVVYAGVFQQTHFANAHKLKWIQLIGHGAEAYLFPEMVDSDIQLTSSGQVHAIPIAEHVFAMMLNHSRKIVELKDGQRRGQWIKPDIYPHLDELYGKVAAIVGMGNIGAEITKRAKAFGMKTLGVRKNAGMPCDYVDEMYSLDDLSRVLSIADYIVLALPGTKETIGLIGENELALMKNSAYLINVGRGNVFKEPELIDALKKRQVAGAGLDVFVTEPLPADSPFYGLEQVLLSPHISGATPHSANRTVGIFAENLKRFLNKSRLLNVVNKKAGY